MVAGRHVKGQKMTSASVQLDPSMCMLDTRVSPEISRKVDTCPRAAWGVATDTNARTSAPKGKNGRGDVPFAAGYLGSLLEAVSP